MQIGEALIPVPGEKVAALPAVTNWKELLKCLIYLYCSRKWTKTGDLPSQKAVLCENCRVAMQGIPKMVTTKTDFTDNLAQKRDTIAAFRLDPNKV